MSGAFDTATRNCFTFCLNSSIELAVASGPRLVRLPAGVDRSFNHDLLTQDDDGLCY